MRSRHSVSLGLRQPSSAHLAWIVAVLLLTLAIPVIGTLCCRASMAAGLCAKMFPSNHRQRTRLLSGLPADARALLRSQSGAYAGEWLRAIPADAGSTLAPPEMLIALRRRLRLPLSLAAARRSVWRRMSATGPRTRRTCRTRTAGRCVSHAVPGDSRSAQQQKPCALQIWQLREHVQKTLLGLQPLLQAATNEVEAAYSGTLSATKPRSAKSASPHHPHHTAGPSSAMPGGGGPPAPFPTSTAKCRAQRLSSLLAKHGKQV